MYMNAALLLIWMIYCHFFLCSTWRCIDGWSTRQWLKMVTKTLLLMNVDCLSCERFFQFDVIYFVRRAKICICEEFAFFSNKSWSSARVWEFWENQAWRNLLEESHGLLSFIFHIFSLILCGYEISKHILVLRILVSAMPLSSLKIFRVFEMLSRYGVLVFWGGRY